jgi:hypothetical protein
MDWVFDHLQILILVAVAVAGILKQLKKVPEAGSGGRSASIGPEAEERTRRIQEEIRRRVMERRGLAPVAPRPGEEEEEARPFPPAPPMIEEIRPVRVEPSPDATALAEARIAAELKRQQEMLERVRALEATQRSRAAVVAAAAVKATEPAEGRLPDLRSRGGLRRAILLREILGPPVGLR